MSPKMTQKAPGLSQSVKNIKGICLDIDDTLSTHGKLTAEAFQALWTLKQAGFFVVPVTGRPAGWCDHIVRFWPVDAVIGENGAFSFFMLQGVRKRLDTLSEQDSQRAQSRIQGLKTAVKARFPNARWASDQSYREYDLAIDFCEDVQPWPASEVSELVEFCESQGAHAKVSSIHVNAWFGNYDKATGLKHWLNHGAPGLSIPPVASPKKTSKEAKISAPSWDEWIFIGDSPNDEPLFKEFKTSFGVANLKNFMKDLNYPPTFLTKKESGEGFCEFSKILISAKKLNKKKR